MVEFRFTFIYLLNYSIVLGALGYTPVLNSLPVEGGVYYDPFLAAHAADPNYATRLQVRYERQRYIQVSKLLVCIFASGKHERFLFAASCIYASLFSNKYAEDELNSRPTHDN